MLCECGEREATVHEVVIHNGKKFERHLCERCAARAGLGESLGPGIDPKAVSQAIMAQVLGAAAVGPAKAEPTSRGVSASCPSCGMDFAEFRRTGLMGCEDCYSAFAEKLEPILERAHDRSCRHVGKVPKRALEESQREGTADDLLGDLSERKRRLGLLRRELSDAVANENYEQAARVRDELRRLTEVIGPSGGSGGRAGSDEDDAGGSDGGGSGSGTSGGGTSGGGASGSGT